MIETCGGDAVKALSTALAYISSTNHAPTKNSGRFDDAPTDRLNNERRPNACGRENGFKSFNNRNDENNGSFPPKTGMGRGRGSSFG
jgi:hypothetical protein